MKIFILPILKFIWVTLSLIFTYLIYTIGYFLYFLWFFKMIPNEWETSTKRLNMSPYQKDMESGFLYLWDSYWKYMLGFKEAVIINREIGHIIYCTKYEKATYAIVTETKDGQDYYTVCLIDDSYIGDKKDLIVLNLYENAITYINNMETDGNIIYKGAVGNYLG